MIQDLCERVDESTVMSLSDKSGRVELQGDSLRQTCAVTSGKNASSHDQRMPKMLQAHSSIDSPKSGDRIGRREACVRTVDASCERKETKGRFTNCSCSQKS